MSSTVLVRCPSCESKLKIPEAAAGKRVRCPICEKPVSIPQVVATAQDAPPKTKTSQPVQGEVAPSRSVAKPRPAPAPKLDDDLEIVEVLRVKDPTHDRPKPKKRRIIRKVEKAPPGAGADMLVWLFLLALIPLVVRIISPGVPLEERVRKTIEKNEELQQVFADEEEGGARAVLHVDPNLTLVGAHLSRNSKMHWVYALITTVVALIVLGIMLVRSTISPVHLLFTGMFTGTFGVLMLLAFQFIAQLSLVGGGGFLMGGGIIGFIIKFIGFSYICALMPGNGFFLSFMGFTCGVGFCEEFCKAWPIKYYLSHAEKSDWRGTFLVGVASGFGFGISEAIMYAGAYYNGIEPGLTYFVRFASCVAFHGLLSGSVALLMFGNQDLLDSEPGWLAFFLNWGYYIGIAMILHGLYDTLLKQELEVGAVVVAIATFGWTFWLARYYWSYDPEEASAVA